MKRSGAGYGPVNNWRWRSVRRFVREQHALTLPGSDLEQAEALLGIAHAFGAVWPADRRGVERRLAWMGIDTTCAYRLSDIVHLLGARPSDLYSPPLHSVDHPATPKRRAS